MKHLFAALLLAALATASALADSPEAILKDYRKQAAQALQRMNLSLKNATTPLITKLVASGDTAGAELLTAQLKDKLSGDPVEVPHASAAQLFSLYDDARAKALAPVQKASIARIDSLLKTAGGAKLETVTELGKVREEIEAGTVEEGKAIPVEWGYYLTPTGGNAPLARIFFEPHGKARNEDHGTTVIGTWKINKKGLLIATFPAYTWTVTFKEGYAELVSPPTPMRYLVPVKK